MASIIFIMTMFDLLWVRNFIKIGKNFSVGFKFAWIYNFGSRPSIPCIIFISMFNLFWVPNFIKIRYILQFWDQICPRFLFRVKIRNFKYRIYDQWTWPALSAKFHSIGNTLHFCDQIFLEWRDWYLF